MLILIFWNMYSWLLVYPWLNERFCSLSLWYQWLLFGGEDPKMCRGQRVKKCSWFWRLRTCAYCRFATDLVWHLRFSTFIMDLRSFGIVISSRTPSYRAVYLDDSLRCQASNSDGLVIVSKNFFSLHAFFADWIFTAWFRIILFRGHCFEIIALDFAIRQNATRTLHSLVHNALA